MLANKCLLYGDSLNVVLTNLTAADAKFLREVLAIFTDPHKARTAHELRTGRLVIQYSPDGGSLAYLDLGSDFVPTAAEVIQFVARFQDWEWDQLEAHEGFRAACRRDMCEAEEIAREVLGYLPEPVRVDVVKG